MTICLERSEACGLSPAHHLHLGLMAALIGELVTFLGHFQAEFVPFNI